MKCTKKKHWESTVQIILLSSLACAQGFNHYHPVPSHSDQDFKVQQSISGQDESGPYYSTIVRGKGKLTKLQINPDSTALLTVEGLKDHAVWLVLMNRTSVEMGAKFWHIGDIIYLDTSTILSGDKQIPKVQNSESSTVNTSRRNCDYRGCWNGKAWEK